MQPKKIEHYKYFQPIAWTICLAFAGFVVILSFHLQTVVKDLQGTNLSFDQRLQNLENTVYQDQMEVNN